MASNKGRTGNAYNTWRTTIINRETHCWLCGHKVDKTLSGRHPLGPTADHIQPITRGGPMLDLANGRLAHRRCNASKGDRTPQPTQDPGPSRQWLTT